MSTLRPVIGRSNQADAKTTTSSSSPTGSRQWRHAGSRLFEPENQSGRGRACVRPSKSGAPHSSSDASSGEKSDIEGHLLRELIERVRHLDSQPDGVVLTAPAPLVEPPAPADPFRCMPEQRPVVVAVLSAQDAGERFGLVELVEHASGVVFQAEALVDEDASDHPAPEVVTQEPRHQRPRVTAEVLSPARGAEDLRCELQSAEAEDSSDHVPGHPRHTAFAWFDLTEEAGEF